MEGLTQHGFQPSRSQIIVKPCLDVVTDISTPQKPSRGLRAGLRSLRQHAVPGVSSLQYLLTRLPGRNSSLNLTALLAPCSTSKWQLDYLPAPEAGLCSRKLLPHWQFYSRPQSISLPHAPHLTMVTSNRGWYFVERNMYARLETGAHMKKYENRFQVGRK